MKHICKHRTGLVSSCPRPYNCVYAELELGCCTYAEEDSKWEE